MIDLPANVIPFLPKAPAPDPPVFRSRVTTLDPLWILVGIAGLVWFLRK